MDDKAKIPVGQPGTPKATTSLMQKAWTAKGVTLESSDHNYHPASIYLFEVNNRDTRTRCEICSKLTLNRKMQAGHAINVTTSANLLCEIPEGVTGSLYTGQIYVGIKDAIFEASDPL